MLSLFSFTSNAQDDGCADCKSFEIRQTNDHTFDTDRPGIHSWSICEGDAIILFDVSNTATVLPGSGCYTIKLTRTTKKGTTVSCVTVCPPDPCNPDCECWPECDCDDCINGPCDDVICPTNYAPNADCQCVCVGPSAGCPSGFEVDPLSCECVCVPPVTGCLPGSNWNEATCSCVAVADCFCGSTSDCMSLDQEGTPQVCGTVFAYIHPSCISDEDCVETVFWSATGPVSYPLPGQEIEGTLGTSWSLNPFGSYGQTVHVSAKILLTSGEVCVVESSIILECGGFAHIGEQSNTVDANKIAAYPNPVQLGNTISVSIESIQEASSVRLFNVDGKLMQELGRNDSTFEVHADWAPGLYFIEVVKAGRSEIIQMVIQE